MFDVDHGVTCEHADNVLAYTVQVSMTVEEPEADGGDATDSNAGEGGVGPVFTADLTLVAVYELSEGEEPGEEALGAFGDLSVRHTVYPYLRELIHTLTMRAGLPPLVLESFLAPVMRDAQR